jgi:hypothetical protein
MIVFESSLAGEAEPLSFNQKSVAAKTLSWGKRRGLSSVASAKMDEGELSSAEARGSDPTVHGKGEPSPHRRQSSLIYRNSGPESVLTGVSLHKCATRDGAFGIRVNSRNSRIRLCASVLSACSCSKTVARCRTQLRLITVNYA